MQFTFNVLDDVIVIFLFHSIDVVDFLINLVLLNFQMPRFELKAF